MLNLTDLGHIIEGVVERDPLTDSLQIHTVDSKGVPMVVDPAVLLARYEGQEVKLTLASVANLEKIAVALGEGNEVLGLMPEDIPGAIINRTHRL